ncbi:MAG: zinc ribbon domain-containing protein [Clostridia bacterium]|nr:zinc ribbon domain-containing protein [Clostridia bacterium]
MFCPYCGKEIDNIADVCLGCGRSVKKIKNSAQQDSSSVGWWWLGFFFPLIGFILWCVWTDNTPIKAKRAGWGALVGAITSVVVPIIIYIAILALTILGGFAIQSVFF